MSNGIFAEFENLPVSFSDEPADNDKIWMDLSTGILYIYNTLRSKWISVDRRMFEYARKGAAKGMYLPLSGFLDTVDSMYTVCRDSVILGVYCVSESGDENKEFEIHINETTAYEFKYDGSDNRIFMADDLNINIDQFDKLNIYITNNGLPVSDTMCRIDTAWRYDI